MTTTPEKALVSAAQHVRKLAAHFDTYHGKDPVDPYQARFDGPVEEWAYWNVERNANAEARAWIVAMSPAIADSLAGALDLASDEARALAENGREVNPNWALLRLAQAILGASGVSADGGEKQS